MKWMLLTGKEVREEREWLSLFKRQIPYNDSSINGALNSCLHTWRVVFLYGMCFRLAKKHVRSSRMRIMPLLLID